MELSLKALDPVACTRSLTAHVAISRNERRIGPNVKACFVRTRSGGLTYCSYRVMVATLPALHYIRRVWVSSGHVIASYVKFAELF